MVIVEIFGTGRESCSRLEIINRGAVERSGIKAEIEKNEDLETLLRRGITATRGLAIDGKNVSMGRVPTVNEIIKILGTKGTMAPPPSVMGIPMVNSTCGCSPTGTIIYFCSGGSNVGQISNEVTKQMISRGMGKFSCLAIVGSDGEGFIASAKKTNRIVVIDGCATRHAYRRKKHTGIEPTVHEVVTDWEIKKDNEQLNPCTEDDQKVLRLVEGRL